jgi:hypothetical protein
VTGTFTRRDFLWCRISFLYHSLQSWKDKDIVEMKIVTAGETGSRCLRDSRPTYNKVSVRYLQLPV